MTTASIYQSRVTTAQEAVKTIKSGNRVFLTGNVSVPQKILAALVEYAPNLTDVEICQALTVGSADYVGPEMEGHLRVNSMFISANIRKAVQEGRADFTPVLLSEFPLLFKRGVLPLDVAVIHVSTPDEHGFCSLGVEVGLTKSAAESAKIIIAEVNEQMPRTLGDAFIHVSRLTHIVPVNYPIPEHRMTAEGDMDIVQKIAGHVASLIPDGATMQLGIGSIPDAVLKFLFDKKDLGIHTELFSDGVIDLVNAGVLTNARKSLHPGKVVAGFILGTKRLYEWVNDNPMVEMHPTEYVNDPFIIAQNDRMVAVNSAIEVDLTGQICADSIGPKLYSGVGGQLDFVYGASRSKGGVPIIALPSVATLRDGTQLSKITAMLKTGAGVVTSRNHVRFVVTEHGIADLYGKTIRQRAQALINVAHPQFREELTRQAKELHYG
ncbi:MAG TPA: acetyl-CoA hydrolase/transferase C-terminal domain-containing protein [Anaerolineales bacterium]|nr:acetyl-CoA hydrolase/transferase C-terminal domain-containing protein [Anaerolineales bacterium]HMV97331.1 acetyl-CoA hydrolase/transferase C-terminal domain-containing protein [Anaerolineales bacterium]HMX19018.1 acetyl-CoA hydrolase/transferase C-terminal domain-containing protein [Anaerolineales bacterium]HMX75828.1 acetyl-CoA hydrolase/transferase C-terminal domain-containing protein [Anaerolineales bacterium]HMZ41515.1 acetyl-CoA hydrolase/transferase C-terminal domain-containing protei